MTPQQIDAMKLALEKIARVNAMDYEYQAWAREALAETQYWDEKYKLLVQEVQEHPQQRTEQNQADFEMFVKNELGDIAVKDAGRYISPKIQNCWKVWQHCKGIKENT